MVTFKDAWNIPQNRRAAVKVKEIMIPKGDLIIMDETRKADETLIQISKKRMGKVFVCNKEGKLIGLVSKTDIMNAASERSDYKEAVRKIQKKNGRGTGSFDSNLERNMLRNNELGIAAKVDAIDDNELTNKNKADDINISWILLIVGLCIVFVFVIFFTLFNNVQESNVD